MKIGIILSKGEGLNEDILVPAVWPYAPLPRKGESFSPYLLDAVIDWSNTSKEEILDHTVDENVCKKWMDVYDKIKDDGQTHETAMAGMMGEYLLEMNHVQHIIWDRCDTDVVPVLRLGKKIKDAGSNTSESIDESKDMKFITVMVLISVGLCIALFVLHYL